MTAPLAIGVACFPSLGGSGVVACDVAAGLAARGHRVHLMASALPSRARPGNGLSFHEVATPEHPLFEHAPYTLALATTIVDVAREHQLDLVQVHYAVPHAASALLARQVLGAASPAFITSLHGTDITGMGAAPAYRSVTSFAVAAADGITVPSDFLRREARSRLAIPADRHVEVIPNFVDTEHFAPPAARDPAHFDADFDGTDRGPVLFHVSNFRPVKRVLDLLEMLTRVRHVTPARLVLVGDGPDQAAAQLRAQELGLSHCVRFLGSQVEFAEHLGHADAFVLPSESESFGVAALEALSAGVPVIAYRVGGLPEVVVEGVGRLVEPQDVEALAAAVVELTTNAELRARWGQAARARALAHFRREPALDRYEDYFHRVLAGHVQESA